MEINNNNSSTGSRKIIRSMLDDIKMHKGRSRDELLSMYILKRLDKQLNVYYQLLISSSNTLSQLSEKRVVKHLTK